MSASLFCDASWLCMANFKMLGNWRFATSRVLVLVAARMSQHHLRAGRTGPVVSQAVRSTSRREVPKLQIMLVACPRKSLQ